MRKPSKMVERTELDRERLRADLAEHYVHCLINGKKPDAVEGYSEPNFGHWRYELWHSTSAAGGLLVTIFSAQGQSKHVDVRYFDQAKPSEYADVEARVAYERLGYARQRVWDSERQEVAV